MFDIMNPKIPGRNSPFYSQVRNLTSDGIIGIANPNGFDGNGNLADPYLYFVAVPTPAGDYAFFGDNKGDVANSPSMFSVIREDIPVLGYAQNDEVYIEIQGFFSGPFQSAKLMLAGNDILTISTNDSGITPWSIFCNVNIYEPSTSSIIAARGQSSTSRTISNFSDLRGTGFAIDWTSAVQFEIVVDDGLGSGVDMGVDWYRFTYSSAPAT